MLEKSTEQKERREAIIDFARKVINPQADEREANVEFSRPIWKSCGEIGLTGMMVPTEFGGLGLDALSCVYALEALGYGSRDTGLNFSLAAHLLACVAPVWQYGSDAQKQQYLPKLCNGDWVASNAITEASSGSDVYTMESTAVKKGDQYLLNGTKTYCSNGAVADIFVTYVLTNPAKGFFGGVSGFIVEKNQHAVTTTPSISKLGIKTCLLAEFEMNETTVATTQLLGEEGGGAQIFSNSMHWERICLGAIHLGAMDWLLEEAVKFANKRKSAAANLSSYQAITHPLANYKVQLEGARLLTYQAAIALQQKSRKVNTLASMAKLAVSECYKGLCVQLMQLYAGAAYRLPHPAEQHLRAAMGATVYSGTSEIHRNLVARDLGLKPKK